MTWTGHQHQALRQVTTQRLLVQLSDQRRRSRGGRHGAAGPGTPTEPPARAPRRSQRWQYSAAAQTSGRYLRIRKQSWNSLISCSGLLGTSLVPNSGQKHLDTGSSYQCPPSTLYPTEGTRPGSLPAPPSPPCPTQPARGRSLNISVQEK